MKKLLLLTLAYAANSMYSMEITQAQKNANSATLFGFFLTQEATIFNPETLQQVNQLIQRGINTEYFYGDFFLLDALTFFCLTKNTDTEVSLLVQKLIHNGCKINNLPLWVIKNDFPHTIQIFVTNGAYPDDRSIEKLNSKDSQLLNNEAHELIPYPAPSSCINPFVSK